ncbi:Inactive angiotensin-converting enzyme-related protein [Trichinella pseudospiralis]
MKAKYMDAREPFKKLFDWNKVHVVANQYWDAQFKITFGMEPPFRVKTYILPQRFLEYIATVEDIQRFQAEDESGDKAFSDKNEEHEYEECAADGEAAVSHQCKAFIKVQKTGAYNIKRSTKFMTAPVHPENSYAPPLQMRNVPSQGVKDNIRAWLNQVAHEELMQPFSIRNIWIFQSLMQCA